MYGELIEMNELSHRVFGLIRDEAERWDGTRPSRSMIAAAGWGLRWAALKVEVGARLGPRLTLAVTNRSKPVVSAAGR